METMELSTQDLLWLELALRKIIAEIDARGDNAAPVADLLSRVQAKLS